MISIGNETLVPLTEVPNHLPRRKGRKLAYSTVFRWVQRGVRGKRLESCRIGGIRFTSLQALTRFFAEPHCDSFPERGESRQRAIAAAQAELDSEGV
jgi:hypothetical protein